MKHDLTFHSVSRSFAASLATGVGVAAEAARADSASNVCNGVRCEEVCCALGASCNAGRCTSPDLRINAGVAAKSIKIDRRTFGEASCDVEEMCVAGSGERRLLHFEMRIENPGPGNLDLRDGSHDPEFEMSPCHHHPHSRDFTRYELRRPDGTLAAAGHKQSFCLQDVAPISLDDKPVSLGTHPDEKAACNLLTAGYADIYAVETPCQWVDITDVAAGEYLLTLSLNPEGLIGETDMSNDRVQIPVILHAEGRCEPQREICGDLIDQDCDYVPDDYDADCADPCAANPLMCEEAVEVRGNETCATAHPIENGRTYQAELTSSNTADIRPSCGGGGGDAFFAFSLGTEQVVYLGALGSSVDTVNSVHAGGCGGTELRCESTACAQANGHFVKVLPPGDYVAVVQSAQPGATGRLRLKFQHATAPSAIVADGPGIYAGDTRLSHDDAHSCANLQDEPDAQVGLAADDVYALAACTGTLRASTCGSAGFDSLLDIRARSLDFSHGSCSTGEDRCVSDPLGAVAELYLRAGLAFVTVDGDRPRDVGEYRLSLSY